MEREPLGRQYLRMLKESIEANPFPSQDIYTSTEQERFARYRDQVKEASSTFIEATLGLYPLQNNPSDKDIKKWYRAFSVLIHEDHLLNRDANSFLREFHRYLDSVPQNVRRHYEQDEQFTQIVSRAEDIFGDQFSIMPM